MKNVFAYGACAILVLFVLHVTRSTTPGPKESVTSEANAAATTGNDGNHTYASIGIFRAIYPGRTEYSLIAGALGEGTLESSSSVGGISTQAYRWTNKDGSNLGVIVQNGIIVVKSQYELP